MKQLTKDEAIALADSGVWRDWSHEEIVRFQLFQDRLCMDFSRFHDAMEAVLGRPIFTHEFAFREQLVEEYLGVRPEPTFQQVMDLIPNDKRIILFPPASTK